MAITLIATGGTIASTRGPDGRVTATRSGAELLAELPSTGAHVDVVDLAVAGSWNLSSEQAAELVGTARRALEDGAEGVVISHGTDVLEETAWLAELLVRPYTDRPVVLTASMRHGSEYGGDGPRNLLDAVRVAGDPTAVGRGALVCVNGELHHARWVTKTHATAVHTFESPGHGPVGEVGEAGVRFVAASPAPPPSEATTLAGRVPVISSHWDADPELVGWYLDGRADALVVEAGGAGNVNRNVADGLLVALDRGVPVVVATRCRRGEVTPIYGGPGGFATLHAAGAVSSMGLSAGKARLTLQAAIAASGGPGGDPARIRACVERLAVLR
jgi:L-asparaginase